MEKFHVKSFFSPLLTGLMCLLAALCFTGCQDQLVNDSIVNDIISAGSNSAVFSCPTNVSACQGGYKNISLNWTASPKAVQYKIYRANTPFNEFEAVGETNGAKTTFDDRLNSPGAIKYYKIRAVDYKGNLSSESALVMGSTLATPTITDIIQQKDSVIVKWWMENCREETYLQDVRYQVNCYEYGSSVAKQEVLVSDGSTSAEIKGLASKTNYEFEVIAWTIQNQSKVEKSERVDAETARITIPHIPGGMKANRGTSEDSISVSWTLPALCDVKVQNAYEAHPLYFVLKRKESGASDSKYKDIASYIGTVKKADKLENLQFRFDCRDGSVSTRNPAEASKLSLVCGTDTTVETSPNYPQYIPGSTITFVDDSAVRGTKYTYLVKAYIDDNGARNVTYEEMEPVAEGWLINDAEISMKREYLPEVTNKDNPEPLEEIKVSFKVTFDDFGENDYQYVITKTGYEINDSGKKTTKITIPEEKIISTASYENIKNATYSFAVNNSTVSTSYSFKLYILPKGSEDFSSFYEEADAPGTVSVTKNRPSTEIKNFKVVDGYSNKFVVSWDYDSNCTYTLSYISNIDSQSGEKKFTATELRNYVTKVNNVDVLTYEAPAISGETRKFTLSAENTGTPVDLTLDDTYQTLGTAVPEVAKYGYDHILVKWAPVQIGVGKTEDTENYAVEAYYEEDSTKTSLKKNEAAISKITENGLKYYTFLIDKPAGYNDITKAGKNIIFEVTASSDKDTSKGSGNVNLIGPASTETSLWGDISADSIKIKWNRVPGAIGYKLYRIKYNDRTATKSTSSDIIFVSNSGKISAGGSDRTSEASVTMYTDSIQFTDIDTPTTANTSYEVNQSQISWGIPFGYYVVPVLNENDDVAISDGALKINTTDYSGKVTTCLSATYGYGINISAEKAEKAYKQVIKWSPPYYNANKDCFIYRRHSSSDRWSYVAKPSTGSTEFEYTFSSDNSDWEDRFSAFEYAVRYVNKSEKFPASYEEMLSTTMEDNSNYDYGTRAVEPKNKGYLLCIGTKAATGGEAFTEEFSFDEWDYSERHLGPDSYTVSIMNYNLLASSNTRATDTDITPPNWLEVATFGKYNNCSSKNTSLPDTEITSANGFVSLKPKDFTTDGSTGKTSTTGALQVLRDARHFYKLTLKRNDGCGAEADVGEDLSIYTYRQITDEELAKAVMLILAECVEKSKMETYGTGTALGKAEPVTGYTGSFKWSQDASSKFNWYIENYCNLWTSLPGIPNCNIPSFITISDPNTGSTGNRRGRKYGKSLEFLCYDETSNYSASKLITIGVSSTIKLSGYNATVKFACNGSSAAIEVYRDGARTFSVSPSTQAETRKWVPISIKECGYLGKKTDYGWWPAQ